LIGENSIPLRHEIEFELIVNDKNNCRLL